MLDPIKELELLFRLIKPHDLYEIASNKRE